METCRLKPIADEQALLTRYPTSLTANYQAVDEGASNADTDYVTGNVVTYGDRYTLSAVPGNFGTSYAVRIKVVARANPDESSRTLYASLFLGGTKVASIDEPASIAAGAYYAEYTFTNAAWNAQFWEKDWADAAVQIVIGAGTQEKWIRITQVVVEIDYYKIARLTPDGDILKQWIPNIHPDRYAMVDEGVDDHDGDTTEIHSQVDGHISSFTLSGVPADFYASKGIEVRFALYAEDPCSNEVTLTPTVNGSPQDAVARNNFATSYVVYRLSHANWQDQNWSRGAMNAATLAMQYDKLQKTGLITFYVSALDLAISYDTEPEWASRADALRMEVSGLAVRHLHAAGTLSGVVIEAVAARNGPGEAVLQITGGKLSFRAPDSVTFGEAVTAASDGVLLVEDGEDSDKWLRVRVYADYLPSGSMEAAVWLTDVFNNGVGHDDVTAAEAASGDVAEYTVTLQNDNPMDLLDVRCWLDAAVSDISISTDGVSYYTPDSEEHADVLVWDRIASQASETLYVKRTIGVASESDADILNFLHLAWDGY